MTIWYLASRNEHIEVSNMTTSHINNTINCLKGLGKSRIPDPFCGFYHYEWLKIFDKKLNIRKNKIYELW